MKINDISDIKNELELLSGEETFEAVKKLINPIFSYLELQGVDPFFVFQNIYSMLNQANSKRFMMDAQNILNGSESNWLTKSNRVAPIESHHQNILQSQELKRPTLGGTMPTPPPLVRQTPVNFHSLAIEKEQVRASIPPTPIKNLNTHLNLNQIEKSTDVFIQNQVKQEQVKASIPPTPVKNLNNPFIQNMNQVEKTRDTLPHPQNVNYGNNFRETLNTKINVNAIQENAHQGFPLNEGLKYLIPSLTEKGKNALKDPSISNETYMLLKLINGVDTLQEINEKNFSQVNNNFIFSLSAMKNMGFPSEFVVIFLNKIIAITSEGFVSFVKTSDTPKDKKFSIKLGELLLYMKILDEEKLERSLELQRAWKPQKNNLSSTKPLFGNLLLSLELLKQPQLTQALEIQKWYNSLRNI